jgi:hypothetical protein
MFDMCMSFSPSTLPLNDHNVIVETNLTKPTEEKKCGMNNKIWGWSKFRV